MDSKVFFSVSRLTTPGDIIRKSSARKIAHRPYREFEFMPELQKQNPIKVFVKKMKECYKGLKETMCSEFKQAKYDEKLNEFSTIERNGSGMFFEA